VLVTAQLLFVVAPLLLQPHGDEAGRIAHDVSAEAHGFGTCTVRVLDIDPPQGLLHASLLRADRGDSSSDPLRIKALPVLDRELAFIFEGIPYGSYTLRLSHDTAATDSGAPGGMAVSGSDSTLWYGSRAAAGSATTWETGFVLEDSLCTIHTSMQNGLPRLATLTITMTGFRNEKGVAQVTLFSSADGFPDKPDLAFMHGSSPIVGGESQITFEQVPFGTYGVGVVHDENANENMDTNFLGKPREGYGASNDARGRFGPPSFQDARVSVEQHAVTIPISIKY
jgi:uncharacterized protein (DUF2141 family)